MSNQQNGYSIVELLLAMLIFAISLLAVLPLFALSAGEAVSSERKTISATLAHAKATNLEAEPLDKLTDGKDRVGEGGSVYLRTWKVKPDSPHKGLTTVTVHVEPLHERSGRSNSATVDLLRDR